MGASKSAHFFSYDPRWTRLSQNFLHHRHTREYGRFACQFVVLFVALPLKMGGGHERSGDKVQYRARRKIILSPFKNDLYAHTAISQNHLLFAQIQSERQRAMPYLLPAYH